MTEPEKREGPGPGQGEGNAGAFITPLLTNKADVNKKLSAETWNRLARIPGFTLDKDRADRVFELYLEGVEAHGWGGIHTYAHLCDNGNPELRAISNPQQQKEILILLELERMKKGGVDKPRQRKPHKGDFAHEARLAELIQTCVGLPERRRADFYARFHGAYQIQGLRGLRLWRALVTDFPEADGVTLADIHEILGLLEVREEWRAADE